MTIQHFCSDLNPSDFITGQLNYKSSIDVSRCLVVSVSKMFQSLNLYQI